MAQYKKILDQLTDEQKLVIAASLKTLALPEYAVFGIPSLRYSDFDKLNASYGGIFPPAHAVANSWDDARIADMSAALAAHAVRRGYNFVFMPGLNAKSPFRDGLTEDPSLTASYADKMSEALSGAGVMPCANTCSLSEEDIRYADIAPNDRAIFNYYVAPFSKLSATQSCAVTTDYNILSGSYENINSQTIGKSAFLGNYAAVISEHVNSDSLVHCIAEGNLVWEGDVSVLRRAYRHYQSLKTRVDRGECFIDELNRECDRGAALDSETLDAAVDRAIAFAFACDAIEKAQVGEEDEEARQKAEQTARKLAEESIVLLKNVNNALPLKKKRKVAIIGAQPAESETRNDEALLAAMQKCAECTLVGAEAGYDGTGERNDALSEKALAAVEEADTVVVLLSFDESGDIHRGAVLPASQAAIIDELRATRKTLVGVMTSDLAPDITFDACFSALLLAPASGAFAFDALAEILAGKACPSGKLAYTCYENAENLFESLKVGKDMGKNKVGCFVGYRMYDTFGLRVRYPFGYGLSYTRFAYSGLQNDGSTLRFRVKNVGTMAGIETAQIYLGCKNSSIARPRKELRAHVRIELAPGEQKTVEVPIPDKWFSVYFEGEQKIEQARYTVFVCSDVGTVQLRSDMRADGEEFDASESTDEYDISGNNILSDGYTFGEVRGSGKAGKAWKFAAIGFGIAAALLLLLVGILYGASSRAGYIHPLLFIVPAVFALAGVVCVVRFALLRKKDRDASGILSHGAARKQANMTAAQSYEMLFDQYFNEKEQQTSSSVASVDAEYEKQKTYDSSRSLAEICNQFKSLAERLGLLLSDKAVHNIIAAISSSRLLILHEQSKGTAAALIDVFGEFFGCGKYVEWFTENYSSPRDLFYASSGSVTRGTLVSQAITSAAQNPERIYLTGVSGVEPAQLSVVLKPLIKYFNYPDQGSKILLTERGSDKTVFVPRNVWFIFTLTDSADPAELYDGLADIASLISVDGKTVKTGGEYVDEVQPFTMGMLEWVTDKFCADFELEEEQWKKIDRFEKYVDGKANYHISGKVWGRLELHSSVLLATGEDKFSALDGTLASKLLLPAFSRLGTHAYDADLSILRAIDGLFGEGNAPISKGYADKMASMSPAARKGGKKNA